MENDLTGKRVVVTGGSGFLGRKLMAYLRANGADTNHGNADLISSPNDLRFKIDRRLVGRETDIFLHIAGLNGGIKFNALNQADIFYANTMMALNVIETCRMYHVKKVVSIVASCAYPEMESHGGCSREVMWEDGFLDGPPHDSVACHGYAKRNLQLASKFYNQQYGLNAVCVCPTTLFGPGDSADPERTKVLMAVVKKVVDARHDQSEYITFWGSGAAYREFLYVEDAAKLILSAAINYNDSSMPLNLGTGHEFTIRELVNKVVSIVGYEGKIQWDTSKPDGQMRKRLDLSRMESVLPKITITPFDEALRTTIDWYSNQSAGASK